MNSMFGVRRRRLASLAVCTAAAVSVLASSGAATVAPITYVRPNNGLVIVGQSGQVTATLVVRRNNRVAIGHQQVSVWLSCYGQRVGPAVPLPITYNDFTVVRHAEFATRRGFRPFSVSGSFSTPTTALVHFKLKSLAMKLGCAPRHGQVPHYNFRLRIHTIHKRGTPPVDPVPGQVSLTLTQCPTNTRANPLQPNQHFQVHGQVLPAHAGEIVRVEYTTVQGQPATGTPTSLSVTQADGTYTADFGVPNNNGIAAEAGISAYAFGKIATCTFFDK
jgi:hypothetical protein